MTRPPAPQLNLAFLGCGWATRMHSATLRGFRREVRCYYASRDRAKALAYYRRFGGGGAFGSYEEAIASPSVDAVFVATPPALHLELALAALAAGKDAIVEKPAFLCASDFDVVRAAERASGRRVLAAENYFYKPLAFALREVVSSGVLGEIRFVMVNAIKHQAIAGWRDDPTLAGGGGGALFEAGVHWINLMSNLGLTVKATQRVRAGGREGPERSALVVFDYEGGAVGTLAYSWEIRSPLRGLRVSKIYGTEGTLTFESNGVLALLLGRKRKLWSPGGRDLLGYRAMFRDFLWALRTGAAAQFTLEGAQRDVRVVEG